MVDLAELFSDLVFAEVRIFDIVEERLQERLGAAVTTILPLEVVASVEDCRVQDLSRQLGISVGGASKAADRLERAGWATRRAHPGDRRSSTLHITPAGRRLLRDARVVVREAMADHLGLSEARQASLARTLAELRGRLTEA